MSERETPDTLSDMRADFANQAGLGKFSASSQSHEAGSLSANESDENFRQLLDKYYGEITVSSKVLSAEEEHKLKGDPS